MTLIRKWTNMKSGWTALILIEGSVLSEVNFAIEDKLHNVLNFHYLGIHDSGTKSSSAGAFREAIFCCYLSRKCLDYCPAGFEIQL